MRVRGWFVAMMWCLTGCPSSAGSGDGSPGEDSSTSATGPGSATDGTPPADGTGTDAGPPSTTGDDTGQGSGDDATTGPVAQCGGSNRCVAAPPADWIGPVSVSEVAMGETPVDCGAGYPTQAEEFSANFVAPKAVCECDCQVPANAACVAFIESYNAAGCGGAAIDSYPFVFGTCYDNPTSTADYWNLNPGVYGDPCTPQVQPPEFPPPTEADVVRICGTADAVTADGCDAAEVCAPIPTAPLAPLLCIYREGEHECPAGPYADASVYFRSYDDERDCSPACECGDVTGTCTGATATLWRYTNSCTSSGLCSNPPCVDYLTPGCDSTNLPAVESIQLTGIPELSNESCPPIGYQPVGDIVPTDPITVCCEF